MRPRRSSRTNGCPLGRIAKRRASSPQKSARSLRGYHCGHIGVEAHDGRDAHGGACRQVVPGLARAGGDVPYPDGPPDSAPPGAVRRQPRGCARGAVRAARPQRRREVDAGQAALDADRPRPRPDDARRDRRAARTDQGQEPDRPVHQRRAQLLLPAHRAPEHGVLRRAHGPVGGASQTPHRRMRRPGRPARASRRPFRRLLVRDEGSADDGPRAAGRSGHPVPRRADPSGRSGACSRAARR